MNILFWLLFLIFVALCISRKWKLTIIPIILMLILTPIYEKVELNKSLKSYEAAAAAMKQNKYDEAEILLADVKTDKPEYYEQPRLMHKEIDNIKMKEAAEKERIEREKKEKELYEIQNTKWTKENTIDILEKSELLPSGVSFKNENSPSLIDFHDEALYGESKIKKANYINLSINIDDKLASDKDFLKETVFKVSQTIYNNISKFDYKVNLLIIKFNNKTTPNSFYIGMNNVRGYFGNTDSKAQNFSSFYSYLDEKFTPAQKEETPQDNIDTSDANKEDKTEDKNKKKEKLYTEDASYNTLHEEKLQP